MYNSPDLSASAAMLMITSGVGTRIEDDEEHADWARNEVEVKVIV